MAQKEWDYWISANPSAVEAEALHHLLELLFDEARRAFHAIEDRVTLVQGREEAVPGIRFESAFGHTPGQVLVSISAGDQTVYNISDMVLDPALAEKRHPSRNPPVKTSNSKELSFLSDAPSNGCVSM